MRRLRFGVLVSVLAVLSLVAGACGDDDGGSTGTGSGGTEETDEKKGKPTEAEAKAALLTTADLPSGWQGGPSDSADDEEEEEEGSDNFCAEFDAADKVDPAAEAEAEFAAAQTGPFVLHTVSLYEDDDQASEVMDLLEEAVEKCKDFTDTDDDLGELKGTLNKTEAGDLGDEAVAAALTAQGSGFKMSGELIVVRQGRGLFMLMQFGMQMEGVGGNQSQAGLTRQLAEKALAKLEAAA